MSSDRSNTTGRTLKPTVASTRVPRSPLTPRIAGGNVTPSTRSTGAKTPSTVRSEPPRVTPRVKQQSSASSNTQGNDALGSVNVTPRSSLRKLRVESPQSTPTQDDTPSGPRPRTAIATSSTTTERKASAGGVGISGAQQNKARASRPQSLVSDDGSSRAASPSIRSPGLFARQQASTDESIDSRFFHASDVQKQEPAPKKPEPKKTPAFFYANGQQEQRPTQSPQATSPVLSAVSEKRTSGPWLRADGTPNPSRSPPMLSPALSTLSSTSSPFFPAPVAAQHKPRSPSPSKENIHLSYRKGASQIFGTRPTPRSTEANPDIQATAEVRRGSLDRSPVFTPHRKSPSLSSIDSGTSHQSRRRSATTADPFPTSSPLTQEVKSSTIPRTGKAPPDLPSIDTSLESTADVRSSSELVRSPTKTVSDLAADARRERKVLDLEISNSSLLAINSSLEREVRRQKAELKRFRRLSRAGRFSAPPEERSARFSEGLSTLGEDDAEGEEYSAFGPPSGFTDVYDDFSDDDGEESVTSGGEPLSPTGRGDRLARDEERLRVDLEKHKELLVQSQMMNQSLKRCMFTTEAMIKDGKKALQYHVRVSDVKLGGRILTLRADEEDEDETEAEVEEVEIEIEDETLHADDAAKGFLDVWQGVGRPSLDVGSEAGDHDSGIEVDKPPFPHAPSTLGTESTNPDPRRLPDEAEF